MIPDGRHSAVCNRRQGEETGADITLERKNALTTRFTYSDALYMHDH